MANPTDAQAQPQAHGRTSVGLVQLAYCSVPSAELDEAGFANLLAQARVANAKHGITGLLLTHTRWMIQWIEGRAPQVHQLWRNIEEDSRHHSVVQLVYREQVSQRLFDSFKVRPATSHDMRTVVREAVAQATNWPGAAPILSIMLDPALSDLYGASSVPPGDALT